MNGKSLNSKDLTNKIIGIVQDEGTLMDKASLLFVSKRGYGIFTSSVPDEKNRKKFLVEYCNEKLTTNPRWAYYAYKCERRDMSKAQEINLRHYKLEAVKDIPWKDIITVIVMSMGMNLGFRGINTPLLMPAIISASFFLCTHAVTLIALFCFNCCTNVKSLFKNMAIGLILLNLMIKIANII